MLSKLLHTVGIIIEQTDLEYSLNNYFKALLHRWSPKVGCIPLEYNSSDVKPVWNLKVFTESASWHCIWELQQIPGLDKYFVAKQRVNTVPDKISTIEAHMHLYNWCEDG